MQRFPALHQEPHIVVPSWRELPSGLLVPSTVADLVSVANSAGELPPELRREPAVVAIVDALPASADQLAGALNEAELGLDVSTLDELVALVSLLPFERAFLLNARLQAALSDVREDPDAQLEFVRGWGVDGLVEAIQAVLRRHQAEGRRLVIFAEQYLTALQRLLVEHALERNMAYEPTNTDLLRTIRAIFAAASVSSAADAHLQEGAPDAQDWLVYLLKNGLYNARPPLVNEITRARELFAVLAPTLAHDQYCPFDEWFESDVGLTAVEQHTAGFAASALAKAFDDEADISDRSLIPPPEWRGDFAGKSGEIEASLTGDREWFRGAFQALGGTLDAIAWERRPFLKRPFIRYENGQWLLIAPRMIASWLGEGMLHRALAAAEERNLSLRASRFIGALFERYCLDLTRSVYRGERPIGAGRVYGEQPYVLRRQRKLTSDIAVDLGTDLVLVEVVSARLTAEMQVAGNPQLLEQNLERMVFKKVKQVGRVARDILNGDAVIPDVNPAHVDRVWPVIVTAGELMQTEMLWDQFDARLPVEFADPRLMQLTVLDVGDFELLLGLVGRRGYHLPDVLDQKARGLFRRLEITRFIVDELHLDPASLRLPIIEERYRALWQEMREVLRFADGGGESPTPVNATD